MPRSSSTMRVAILSKTAVVGNHDQAAFKRFCEQVFQPDNRINVQMVGRLVQQQYVGLLHPSLRQSDTLFLTAGKVTDFRFPANRVRLKSA